MNDYKKGDLLQIKGRPGWWIVDSDSDLHYLYVSPEKRKHQVWDLIEAYEITNHIRPRVQNPVRVDAGPRTL